MGMKASPRDIAGDLPDAEGLLALMGQDKKVRDGRIAFVLARDIGAAFVSRDTDPAAALALLRDRLQARA
jgi:3-dehydroquinate synthase